MTQTTGQTPRPGTESEETLGALIATASRDLSALVRSEVELAKAELKQEAKRGATGGAMFGAAVFLALLAVVMVSIALAEGLVALGLDPWLAFLIVTVLYLLIAAVLVLLGRRSVSKLGPPERTIRTGKDTVAFLKSPLSADAQPPTT